MPVLPTPPTASSGPRTVTYRGSEIAKSTVPERHFGDAGGDGEGLCDPDGVQRYARTMARAIFDGVVVADSDDVRVVGGISYFPRNDVRHDALVESDTTTRCPWKGKARYWHVAGEDGTATDAAFAYERPWPLARRLVSDRVAFWREVEVLD